MNTLPQALPSRGSRRWTLPSTWTRFRYSIAVYAGSRLAYMLLLLVDAAVQHANIGHGLRNWDGKWYVLLEKFWYPDHFSHWFVQTEHYSTFGFLPLYPMLMWPLVHILQIPPIESGFLVALLFGGIATVCVTELAEQWWGEAAAKRALLFWCFFPGTVVFSMVYSEGLTIALVAGCFLLLARKRWVWAGILAGLSTAVAPVAVAAIPACAVAAYLELRERGWIDRRVLRDRSGLDRGALRSLWAPILSPAGLIAFGIYLWFAVGTPLASYQAQHGAWMQTTSPLAVPRVFGSLMHQIFIGGVGANGPSGIDINGVLALLGTGFLIYGLWRLWKLRQTLPPWAWTWVVVVSFLALTSKAPPNPRLLICVFPVVLIVGAEPEGRAWKWLMAADIGCMLLLSWFTYVGIWLRP